MLGFLRNRGKKTKNKKLFQLIERSLIPHPCPIEKLKKIFYRTSWQSYTTQNDEYIDHYLILRNLPGRQAYICTLIAKDLVFPYFSKICEQYGSREIVDMINECELDIDCEERENNLHETLEDALGVFNGNMQSIYENEISNAKITERYFFFY